MFYHVSFVANVLSTHKSLRGKQALSVGRVGLTVVDNTFCVLSIVSQSKDWYISLVNQAWFPVVHIIAFVSLVCNNRKKVVTQGVYAISCFQ